jgi:hypothetical protein
MREAHFPFNFPTCRDTTLPLPLRTTCTCRMFGTVRSDSLHTRQATGTTRTRVQEGLGRVARKTRTALWPSARSGALQPPTASRLSFMWQTQPMPTATSSAKRCSCRLWPTKTASLACGTRSEHSLRSHGHFPCTTTSSRHGENLIQVTVAPRECPPPHPQHGGGSAWQDGREGLGVAGPSPRTAFRQAPMCFGSVQIYLYTSARFAKNSRKCPHQVKRVGG